MGRIVGATIAASGVRIRRRRRDAWMTRLLSVPLRASAFGGPLWILALLGLSWGLTWVAGGEDMLPPHLFYIPVLFAGLRFGPGAAVATAVVAGILAGPLTPADVSAGTQQALSDWVTRLCFFAGIGGVTTLAFERTRSGVSSELEDLRLSRDLQRALNRGELRLEYQPLVALDGQRFAGVEALIRWDHPDKGTIPPDDFVPMCEDNDMVVTIGEWTLMEACRQAVAWRDEVPGQMFPVSVNVSGRQLGRPDLAQTVRRALKDSGLEAEHLMLEVTESALLEDIAGVTERLRELQWLGVRVAVDDFGTGYSALAYLRELPVDVVKIDKTFVQALGERRDEAVTIVAAVITLTHDLGKVAIGEGVERPEQSEALRSLGCDQAQGFYYSAPRPPDELTALLREGLDPARHGETVVDVPAEATTNGHRPRRRTSEIHPGIVRRFASAAPDQREAKALALGALYAAGALLAVVVALIAPEGSTDPLTSALIGASGFPAAALLYGFRTRLPDWTFHVMLAFGGVIVSVGLYLSIGEGPSAGVSAFFVWIALYAGFFFGWRAVAVHLLIAGSALGIALDLHGGTGARAMWILLMGTCVAAAAVIGWLSRQIRTLAATDVLTGLPNRQAFASMLPREMARSARQRSPLCLAVVDLDGFKEINDTHGHQMGDRILAELPSRMRPTLRASDVLARYGGDEFVVLLPDCPLEEARLVLGRMINAGVPHCSVGVTSWVEGEPPDRFLARADRALYTAKRGADQVVAVPA